MSSIAAPSTFDIFNRISVGPNGRADVQEL